MTTIALGQFNASSDREHNLREMESLIAEGANAGSDIICFHEISTTTYFCFKEDESFRELAEPANGYSVTRIQEAAKRRGIAVIFPFYELGEDGRRYNTALVIDREGNSVGKYRKMSIPFISRTVDTSETPANEQFYFEPGNLGFPVFNVVGLRVGILICYDRYFTEAARIIGLQGADILFVPTATYRRWIRRVWEPQLIGHAISNNYYVAGVNRVGVEAGGAPNRSYFGSSVVIDPTGTVIARASDSGRELLMATISHEMVQDTRDLWGFFRNRRPDAYGALVESPRVS